MAGDLSITYEWNKVMSFGTPIGQIYHSLFIKNPAESFNLKAYIEPMHWKTWSTILLIVLILPFILAFVIRYLSFVLKSHRSALI